MSGADHDSGIASGSADRDRASAQVEQRETLQLTLEDAVRRAVENNPDLAIVRLGTEVEAARVGESRGRSRRCSRRLWAGRATSTPPANFLLGERGVDVNDWFSSTGVRQRLPWGSGTWSVSWDTVADHDQQSAHQLRSEPAVGHSGRVLAAAAQGPQDRRGAPAVHHREAEPGELGAALPRVGRPDGGGRQAGVLDAEGDDRQRQRPAAIAGARAGARAPEQDPRRCRADPAARSGAGRGRGGAAAREPDSRATPRRRTPRIALRRLIMDPADAVRSGGCGIDPVEEPAGLRSAARHRRGGGQRARASATTSRAPVTTWRTRGPTWSILGNQRLPDVRLETSYRGNGLGGTQFLRDRRISGCGDRHAQSESRRCARPGVHPRLSDVEPRRHGQLSARPQLRGGELRPGARSNAGRRRSGSRACSFRRRKPSGGRAGRCAAPPSVSTRRVPARRWRSSGFDAEQRRFEVGLSTTFLVTQAQRDLLEAQVNLLQTTLDYESALVNFEAVQQAPPLARRHRRRARRERRRCCRRPRRAACFVRGPAWDSRIKRRAAELNARLVVE